MNAPSNRLAAIATHSRACHGDAGARAGRAGNCSTLPRLACAARATPIGDRLIQYGCERAFDPGAQRTLLLDTAGQRRISFGGRGDFTRSTRVELAVHVGHQDFVVVVHGGFPFSVRAAASAVRPRASRLVSVPIGISSTSAASL